MIWDDPIYILEEIYVYHFLVSFYFVVLTFLVYNLIQGLWLRLLKLGSTDDPLSSFEYGTILGKLTKIIHISSWSMHISCTCICTYPS